MNSNPQIVGPDRGLLLTTIPWHKEIQLTLPRGSATLLAPGKLRLPGESADRTVFIADARAAASLLIEKGAATNLSSQAEAIMRASEEHGLQLHHVAIEQELAKGRASGTVTGNA